MIAMWQGVVFENTFLYAYVVFAVGMTLLNKRKRMQRRVVWILHTGVTHMKEEESLGKDEEEWKW